MSKAEKKVFSNPNFECLKLHMEHGTICLMEAVKTVTDLYYAGHFTFDDANTAIRLLAKLKV